MNFRFSIPVVLLMVLLACQGSDLEQMDAVDDTSLPDEVSTEVTLTYSDSGRVKRIITAPVIHKFTKDTNYMIFPDGLHAQFFNNQGVKVTELTCGYGWTGEKNEVLTFRKNVKITNEKNETLISDEIYLKDDYIFSDSTVYIITPSISLRGTSLVAPKDFSSYKLTNPVGVAKAEALKSQSEAQ